MSCEFPYSIYASLSLCEGLAKVSGKLGMMNNLNHCDQKKPHCPGCLDRALFPGMISPLRVRLYVLLGEVGSFELVFGEELRLVAEMG